VVFSSVIFLVWFLPLFLILYYLAPRKVRNAVILLASLVFYAWGAPKFIFILVGTILVDFYLVKGIYHARDRRIRNLLLTASLLLSVGILLYFKYANFFLDNISLLFAALGMDAPHWTRIALPIGISFFTFQKITYAIDIYRKQTEPTRNAADYLLYVIMFPQLIAGPIVRYNTIAKQINDRSTPLSDRIQGFVRFCIGLAKKVILANTLGETADQIFDGSLTTLGTADAWLGLLAYSFQIYYDFAGYSDMAIGLGKMIGFTFPENFNSPYLSGSITEFWRRWHITLGQWMRDYLYIPLGGNRVNSKSRLYLNLWIVFLISGLWHGASWNFVIWGAWHGLFLALDRLFLLKFLRKAGRVPAVVLTFLISMLGWVFFRLEHLQDALVYFGRLFSFSFQQQSEYWNTGFAATLLVSMIFGWIVAIKPGKKLEGFFYRNPEGLPHKLSLMVIAIILYIICMAFIVGGNYNPFIYFRF
jgi:alginate O-acetyltransferase complex protein AlgI